MHRAYRLHPAIRIAPVLLLGLFTGACDLDSLTGPEGPEGPVGPAGPAGPPGAQGQGGGASLISRTITINNASYVPGYSTVITSSGQAQRPARIVTVTDDRITQQVIESGAILVYMQVPEEIQSPNLHWAPLPYRTFMVLGRYYWNWTFDVRPGQLRILFFIDQQGDRPTPTLNSVTIPTQTFRMVLIPPG